MPLGRLILSGAKSGEANMALDRELLERFIPGVSRPVVRLYRWSPACFSVGHSQDPAALLSSGPVVRRPTGGGLLYHDDEVTYAIILSPGDLEGGEGVKETFAALTGFLILAYKKLGLSVSFAGPRSGSSRRGIEAICLNRREDLDLTVNGKKIGGNAQKRVRGKLLQHGSIPLSLNPDAYRRALKDPDLCDLSGVTSLSEALGRRPGYEEVQEAVIEAAEEHFGLTLKRDPCDGTTTSLASETARL